MKLLILGSNGQLGENIRIVANSKNLLVNISEKYKNLEIVFLSSDECDIRDKFKVECILSDLNPDIVINCAGFTNVDDSEIYKETALEVNSRAVENLARISNVLDFIFVHISSDYVFDGKKGTEYDEYDIRNPLNYYGYTKMIAEDGIVSSCNKYFVIRTSWLYSGIGKNFYTTILKLAKEKKSLNIIDDQVGTPTNAMDLATDIFKIIDKCDFGIYNYSNLGSCSWFEFAKSIAEFNNLDVEINKISSEAYNQLAKRPKYSVLSKQKLINYEFELNKWEESLQKLALESLEAKND